ncbi:MAG: cobalt-precorrin-6A reductase [Ascidiaceihabitans sp.]|nr:cobalt-precorrin-6A reductase [Ascidiaceihabitans sp.]
MAHTLLILGGTTEATALAIAVHEAGITATFSYAGRVARPKRQPLPTRIGGFGGVDGLVNYIRENGITHVVDATHPFAAQMSMNAVDACGQTGTQLIALTRPKWQADVTDNWTHVPDIDAAVAALNGPPKNVMLAIGRMHLDAFAPQPQHRYLLRLVDAPDGEVPLPNRHIVVDQGPFSVENDIALMREHGVELIVSKNAGGTGARAKIDAARALNLPIIMIDRPAIPARPEVGSSAQVLAWLDHSSTERGV